MLALVGLAAGCATITRGTNDALVVNSTPGGVCVSMSDGQACDDTSCTFKVPRRSELNLLVQRERCEPQQIRVTNRVAGGGGAATAGNVLVGGLIGAAVDSTSGAMLELVPKPVKLALNCR